MRRVALGYYLATVALAGFAWVAWKLGPGAVVLLALVSSLGLSWIACRLGVLRVEEPTAGPSDCAGAEKLTLGNV